MSKGVGGGGEQCLGAARAQACARAWLGKFVAAWMASPATCDATRRQRAGGQIIAEREGATRPVGQSPGLRAGCQSSSELG